MISKGLRKELKTTFYLSIPIIVAQLGVILMGVTDNIIVGRLLGKEALGAAAIGHSMAFLLASLATGGLSVLAPMVSKLVAEKNRKEIQVLFIAGFWVVLTYTAVLTLINLGLFANFQILDQPKAIESLASNYFLVVSSSNIFLFFFIFLKQFADGFSLPRISMYITFVGLIFNGIMNVVLIKGLFGFNPLGLIGSAWATFIARVMMAFFILLSIFSNNKIEIFARLKVGKQIYLRWFMILSKAVPAGLQFFFEIGAFTFAVIMMGWISDIALAAHQIAINIASTTYMMATGIAFAGGIRVGDAWGKKSPSGIHNAAYAAYAIVFVFMSLCMVVIFTFDNVLLNSYINDQEVIKEAMPLLLIAAFFQLSDGLQAVGLGVLRGLQDVKIPTFITFIAYWLIALPGGYYLGFILNYKAVGIWWGLLIGLTFSAICLFWRYQNLIKPYNIRNRFAQ